MFSDDETDEELEEIKRFEAVRDKDGVVKFVEYTRARQAGDSLQTADMLHWFADTGPDLLRLGGPGRSLAQYANVLAFPSATPAIVQFPGILDLPKHTSDSARAVERDFLIPRGKKSWIGF
jgi:hypothetical protein